MKNLWKNRILFLLIAVLPLMAQAQSDDDLYYDPAWDAAPVQTVYVTESTPPPTTYREELPSYEDEYDDYDYWDEQGYFYSSRIRRFHRPYRGFGYYDPVYTDLGFYDPWIMPGSSIYINIGGGSDYWSWRRYNRYRFRNNFIAFGGWNTWGWRYYSDPWSYNSWGAYRVYDPWFDPYWGGACFNPGWNYGWNSGWGYHHPYYNHYGNYYYNDIYNQPGYWYGNNNGTVTSNPKGTYFGPRTPGSRTGPSRGTIRNPEYAGGGIPILKESLGRPSGPIVRDQDGGQGNGRVIREKQRIGERDKQNNRPGVDKPALPRKPQTTDPVRKDPLAPATRPNQPTNRDKVGERDRWSDIQKEKPSSSYRTAEKGSEVT